MPIYLSTFFCTDESRSAKRCKSRTNEQKQTTGRSLVNAVEDAKVKSKIQELGQMVINRSGANLFNIQMLNIQCFLIARRSSTAGSVLVRG